jgi:putative transposase
MRKTRFTEQQIIGILKVFPLAQVHLVSWKDRRAVAAALKEIQRAPHAEAGRAALEDFAEGSWDRKYSAIAVSWRRHWAEVVPFYAFPSEVRRLVYTTDEIDKAFLPGSACTARGC